MNMLEMAKDLIQKGNELGDPELISMGMAMLEKYREDAPALHAVEKLQAIIEPAIQPQYECTSCGHTMPFDKPGRKKCPVCKKHALMLLEPPSIEVVVGNTPPTRRPTTDDFSTQIRQTNKQRIRYNEDGVQEGTYARTEQIEGITNIWSDDKTEGFDAANEQLKQFTKFTPRTRKPPKLLKVVCDNCKSTYQVHPIHAGGRAKYTCDRCMKKRSRV